MAIVRLIGNWQYLARWQYLEHLPTSLLVLSQNKVLQQIFHFY